MTEVSVKLGTGASILGLTATIPPRVAEDDVTIPESDLESALSARISMPYTNTLLRILRENVITEPNTAAAVKAILYTASLFEMGNIVKPYYEDDTLFISFRSRRKVIDLDAILKPYYGNVTPAIRELQASGVHPAICEWLLDRFMSDNGLYRACAVACMCVIAALADLGVTVTI